jgi:CDP-4-dehydro-6-deoxyglucose reductase/terephthalate 1,2-dioxygenase reductase component
MANAPHQSDCLQLHVRHLPGGRFTEVVRDLAAGANLDVELPFGSFSLSASQRPMLCVATGTGFSPIQSILDHMARQQTHRHVTLVWGGRDRHGLYLQTAVERWKKLWPDFRFLAAIEDPSDAAAAGAFCGRVDAAVRSLALDLTEHEVYCCGVPLMVAAVRNLCVDVLGLDASRFHSDAFTSPQAQES